MSNDTRHERRQTRDPPPTSIAGREQTQERRREEYRRLPAHKRWARKAKVYGLGILAGLVAFFVGAGIVGFGGEQYGTYVVYGWILFVLVLGIVLRRRAGMA